MAVTVPPGYYNTDSRKAIIQTRELSVGVTPILLFPESLHRAAATIYNASSFAVYLGGDSTVNTNTGHILDTHQSLTILTSAEVWVVAAATGRGITTLVELFV